MKQENETRSAKTALAAGYAGMVLLWLWRTLRGTPRKIGAMEESSWVNTLTRRLENVARKVEHAAEHVEPERAGKPPEAPEPALPSLSLQTPGYAPLDDLARFAAAKQGNHTPPPPFGRAPLAWKHDDPVVHEVLNYQGLEQRRLEGWNEPKPAKLPVPTFAPAIMAFGIIMFAMGLATIWYVCAVGSVIFAVAAWRWVGELQED